MTFRDYLLVAQDEPRATHYKRKADDAWERRDVTDLEATLSLESVGCSLTMREIYDDVTFPTL